jgi:hypothetical protein
MRMPDTIASRLLLVGLFASAPLTAQQLEVTLDGRLVSSNSRTSFLDGGLGKLRADASSDGAELGRLRFAMSGALGESFHYVLDASAWSAHDTNPIDLTEAYLEWRPAPSSVWRSRVKAGAFYPAISLEHRASGWTNPYFLNSSALNTWIGEELRTIGLEYNLDWLGAQRNSQFDFGLTAAAYGWNDPAGVVVALRGFALHDRQTPLFGRLRTWVPGGGRQQRVLFDEIDGRPGYYVGAQAKYSDRILVRALHYDNRADPGAYDASIDDNAWLTQFDSAGVRVQTAGDWTLMAQWLSGATYVGDNAASCWDFDAQYLLLAKQLAKHRIAARYDWFATTQVRSAYPGLLGRDRGNAQTVAWSYEPVPRLEITAEYLQVDSNYNRRQWLGENPRARETTLQIGVRYTFEMTRP